MKTEPKTLKELMWEVHEATYAEAMKTKEERLVYWQRLKESERLFRDTDMPISTKPVPHQVTDTTVQQVKS